MEKNLGHATAYGYAKSKGYTGTEEEFGVLMASYASVAQDASQSASSAAESAQLASNEAQKASQSATSAHNDAETASNIKTDVESARDITVSAKNATVEAKDISVEAKNSAISAKDTAESKAQIAEAWAVGQKDGTDVPSTDGTYHNNAKYYSEQADIAKTNAESAQQLAQTSATSASESSSNAAASAQTANQAAQTATDKASEASQSASTATNKASEASQSATSASQSAATATNKAFEATTAATTATTKASEAATSATTASTAKTNAETARDTAAQSANEAAASAIEAAQSAQSVDAERLNRIAFGSYVVEESSGSIVSFSDGADNIPMKDVLVHIEPVQAGSGDPSPDNVRPITGWTGAKVTRTGKNLAYLFDDGYVPSTSTGQLVQYAGARTDYIKIEPSKPYYAKVDPSTEQFFLLFYDANKGFIRYNAGTEYISTTPPSNAAYAILRVTETQFANSQIQLEQSEQATDYEPYSGQTYDITFPSEAGTVYGGTIDVTSGVLTVDRAIVDCGTLSWIVEHSVGHERAYSGAIDGIKPYASTYIANAICSQYTVASNNTVYNHTYDDIFAVDNNGRIQVYDSRYISASSDEFKTAMSGVQLVYELASPITYQLTPQEITSLLGTNNLWADTGDLEVSYCVDPTLLLDNESSEIQSIKSMIAGVESSAVATKNYSIGDLVIVGDTLYEVTAAIASGETISVSNARVTTVDDVIRNRIAAVDNVIENKIADSIDATLTQSEQAADAKTVGDAIASEDKKALAAFATDTASGAVANFPDGADNIPMKDVLVHIEPVQAGSGDPSPENVRPISGWTGCEVQRAGKNLLDIEPYRNFLPMTQNGITWSKVRDGVYHVRGTATDISYFNLTFRVSVENAMPCTSFIGQRLRLSTTDARVFPTIGYFREDGTNINITDGGIVPDDAVGLRAYVKVMTDTVIDADFSVQLELGSIATDYEPYSGQTYDITFPTEAGTVYGGTLDVTKGELVVDRAMVDIGTLTWTSWLESGTYIFNAVVDGKKQTRTSALICSQYKPNYLVSGWRDLVDCEITGSQENSRVYIRDQRFADNAAFTTAMSGVQLVYELATPITYTLTPQEITSLLGTNNVWADTGNSNVEYRADTKLYVDNLTRSTEDDMTANANISKDAYFTIGNTLYKASTAISAGETIVPNTNCTIVSLADALNTLAASTGGN